VREHDLGLLFPSGDALALQAAIGQLARAPADEMARRQAAVRAAAPSWTRATFRAALLTAFDRAALKDVNR
jgi:hypothetical protein